MPLRKKKLPYEFLMNGLGLSSEAGIILRTSEKTRDRSRGGWKKMTLTVFMAICILGCDVLIYFLFQWTLGEKGRTRRRRGGAKRRLASGQETELFVVPAPRSIPARRARVLQYRNNGLKKPSLPVRDSEQSSHIDEATAYRRRAAAFASPKQNHKFAV